MIKINYKILIIDIILLVTILIVLCCCCGEKDGVRAEEDIAYCLKKCEFPQAHNYIIIDSLSSSSYSEALLHYTLILNKTYYDTLFNEIISKPFHIKSDSIYSLPSVYDRNSDTSKVKEAAFSYKGQTTYERFYTKIGEVIRITLKKDSILSIELQSK